ncbi:MAG: hypothetical protein A2020_11430 [Lentisphaerae bacterium GWF2_45_14]|nr:MAG: hypothetical protein A2020_11430 [Lentisphaerae bacterium GWF2_45_14]
MKKNKPKSQTKSKALIPKLRFPEFRNAPEWEVKTLGNISGVVRGGSPRPIDGFLTADKCGLNWLKIGDVDKEAKYVTNTKEKVRKEALSKTREVNPGDLILSNSMSFGRPYILKIKTCIHDGWIAISTSIRVNSEYLYYFIASPSCQTYFVSNAAGSGVQNLNAEIIKSLSIAFPKKQEQQKISDCLSSLDELIAAESKKLEFLKAHKKGLMQQLFPAEGETVPRFRFPEFRNKSKWRCKPLHKIATPVSGKALEKNKNNILTLSGEYGLVLQSEYFGKRIAGENIERYIRISRNDFVYNDRTTKSFSYGSIKRLSNYEGGIVSPIYKCFRFNAGENPVFWEWYFESGSHEPQLHGLINEGARAGRFNISSEKFLSTLAWHPEPPEQEKIADCLSSLDELIATQSQKINKLKTHKKGLMQQLFPSANEVK